MQLTNGHIMDPQFCGTTDTPPQPTPLTLTKTGGGRCETRCPSAAVVKNGACRNTVPNNAWRGRKVVRLVLKPRGGGGGWWVVVSLSDYPSGAHSGRIWTAPASGNHPPGGSLDNGEVIVDIRLRLRHKRLWRLSCLLPAGCHRLPLG